MKTYNVGKQIKTATKGSNQFNIKEMVATLLELFLTPPPPHPLSLSVCALCVSPPPPHSLSVCVHCVCFHLVTPTCNYTFFMFLRHIASDIPLVEQWQYCIIQLKKKEEAGRRKEGRTISRTGWDLTSQALKGLLKTVPSEEKQYNGASTTKIKR